MEDTQDTSQQQPDYQRLESNHSLTQWLRTYLLWAHVMGVEPQVFVWRSQHAPSTDDNLFWRAHDLWVAQSLLQGVPPRLLAIIAVHKYLEEETWRRYRIVPWLLAALSAVLLFAVASYLQRHFGANLLWHLLHLFVIPILLDVLPHLRERVRLIADDEIMQRLAEPDMLFLAFETAILESLRNGATDKAIQSRLKRLNRLRRKYGEAELTLEQLKAQVELPQKDDVPNDQQEED